MKPDFEKSIFFDFLFTMSNSYRCILSWKPWKVNLRQFLLLYLASGSISYGESKCLISAAKIIEGIRVHQTMKFVLLRLLQASILTNYQKVIKNLKFQYIKSIHFFNCELLLNSRILQLFSIKNFIKHRNKPF